MTFEQRRAETNRLRDIPLQAVLLAAGAKADRRDPAKWHTAQGTLSVNGAKFINWKKGRGGGGAIDLAMQINAMDFLSALQWLALRFPPAKAARPADQPSKQSLTLPTPDIEQLCRVKRYLIEQRRIPDTILEPLIQTGRLYADSRANAVFLLLGPARPCSQSEGAGGKEGRAVGAELRGTSGDSWRGLAPGSCKDLGYFFVGAVLAREAVLCESAIDAISCHALYPERLCISTAGARPNPAWLTPMLAQGCHIYCGFDADPTGDRMAQTMSAIHPTVQRLRPPLHDWNDLLQAFA